MNIIKLEPTKGMVAAEADLVHDLKAAAYEQTKNGVTVAQVIGCFHIALDEILKEIED